MKLEKAIQILDHYDDPLRKFTIRETKEAVKLLIEAGKTIQEMRHHPFPDGVILLEGETPPENPPPRLAAALSARGLPAPSKALASRPPVEKSADAST